MDSAYNLFQNSLRFICGVRSSKVASFNDSLDSWQRFVHNPGEKNARLHLKLIALTGCYDSEQLDQFYQLLRQQNILTGDKVMYYFASLYLQLGEQDKCGDILLEAGISRDMSWFAALMLFARANNVAIPSLTKSENLCLDYLHDRITDPGIVLAEVVKASDTIDVAGNAPQFRSISNCVHSKSIYFNDYQKNTDLSNVPVVHVVTPSWDLSVPASSPHLFITGNNIFYRCSRVWRKFRHLPDYQTISCFPRQQWTRLYQELDAPPSAGLLMVEYLSRLNSLPDFAVHVSGFSDGTPTVNHAFDRVSPSNRHRWQAEYDLRLQAIERIHDMGRVYNLHNSEGDKLKLSQ